MGRRIFFFKAMRRSFLAPDFFQDCGTKIFVSRIFLSRRCCFSSGIFFFPSRYNNVDSVKVVYSL